MNKHKLTAVLLLGALAITTLGGCGKASSQSSASAGSDKALTKVSIMLDWTPNTNHSGLYVAKKMGYFKDAGLDVDIVEASESGAEASVAAGTVNFGISFQDSLVPAFAAEDSAKLPITAIAAIIQHNTSGIISLKDKKITSPSKMEGHSYATWDMPIEQAIIKKTVTDDGGSYDKIKMISTSVEDIKAALQTNIDSVWIYYAWDGIAAKVGGLDTNFFYFKDYAKELDYYSPVIIANNDFLKKHPDTAKAFMAAVSKGYDYAIKHPEDAASILVAANEGLDPEICKESQIWLAKQYQSDASKWGVIDKSRWDGFYKWIHDNHLSDIAIPSGYGFSNDYLPE